MKNLHEIEEISFEYNILEEPFIDLQHEKWLYVDVTRKQIRNQSKFFSCVRESVFNKLYKASFKLPKGVRFILKEGYRPSQQQIDSFQFVYDLNKSKYPELNEIEIRRKTSEYVAPITVAGHPTGGALDLTLSLENSEIFMGSHYNEDPEVALRKNYFNSENINYKEKELRDILYNSLAEDFVNYPYEWWHWSFGDKYWSYTKNKPVLYNTIDESKIVLTKAST